MAAAAADYAIIVIFLAGILGVGFYQAWRQRQAVKKGAGSASYFLAGRDTDWISVGASLFSSNIGAEHFTGLAGSGASFGLVTAVFEWWASIILLMLAYLFMPVYLAAKINTTPEYLNLRFSNSCRVYYSFLLMIIYVFTKISVTIFAGTVVLEAVLGWDVWTSSAVLIITTALYVIGGGLRAVIYTELVQTIVLLIGGLILFGISLDRVGGWDTLESNLPDGHFSLFKGISDRDFPWFGVLFGAPVSGIYYWCTDQHLVQRVLSAKNKEHAQAGSILGGFLKVLPVYMLVVPGMAAAVLFSAEIAEDANIAYPKLVVELMPTGLLGLMVASMLSALMSSLASVFNSASSIIAYDIYRWFRPQASETMLISVGRLSSLAMVAISVIWVPIITSLGDDLFIYIQEVTAYLTPPIASVYCMGIFWPRANWQGAIAGFMVGLILGGSRLIAVFVTVNEDYDDLPGFIQLNYLIFGFILACVTGITIFTVSLLTPPPENDLRGLCWQTRHEERDVPTKQESQADLNKPGDASVSLEEINAKKVDTDSSSEEHKEDSLEEGAVKDQQKRESSAAGSDSAPTKDLDSDSTSSEDEAPGLWDRFASSFGLKWEYRATIFGEERTIKVNTVAASIEVVVVIALWIAYA